MNFSASPIIALLMHTFFGVCFFFISEDMFEKLDILHRDPQLSLTIIFKRFSSDKTT